MRAQDLTRVLYHRQSRNKKQKTNLNSALVPHPSCIRSILDAKKNWHCSQFEVCAILGMPFLKADTSTNPEPFNRIPHRRPPYPVLTTNNVNSR